MKFHFQYYFHLSAPGNNNIANLLKKGASGLTGKVQRLPLELMAAQQSVCNSQGQNEDCPLHEASGVHQEAGRPILPKDTRARPGHSDCQEVQVTADC